MAFPGLEGSQPFLDLRLWLRDPRLFITSPWASPWPHGLGSNPSSHIYWLGKPGGVPGLPSSFIFSLIATRVAISPGHGEDPIYIYTEHRHFI